DTDARHAAGGKSDKTRIAHCVESRAPVVRKAHREVLSSERVVGRVAPPTAQVRLVERGVRKTEVTRRGQLCIDTARGQSVRSRDLSHLRRLALGKSGIELIRAA